MLARILVLLTVTIPICSITGKSQTSPPVAATEPAPPKPSATDIATLQKQADTGDPSAQFALGSAYDSGNGVRQDPKQAAVWYRKAAEQGSPKAQNSLGVLYWLGNGVERNKAEAVQWYRKAARQGDGNAMFNLGAAYYNGEGVATVNDTLAYAWFVLSSEAGSSSGREAAQRSKSEHGPIAFSDACFAIGQLYDKGEDLPQNSETAATWYRKAADAHHVRAQIALAVLAIDAKNYGEARRWCEAASKERSSDGYFCLGGLYQRGFGVPSSTKDALKWYGEAAKWGNAAAMLAMAQIYAKGEGIKLDRPQAFVWFFIAARGGNQDALSDAKQLRALMSEKEWKDTQKKLKQHSLDPKEVDSVLERSNAQSGL